MKRSQLWKIIISIILSYILFDKLIANEYFVSFYASLSAVIVLQNEKSKTFQIGLFRVLGTIIGSFYIIICFFIIDIFSLPQYKIIIVVLGLILIFELTNLFNFSGTTPPAVVVILSILFIVDQNQYIFLAVRTIETLFGVIIALTVDHFLDHLLNLKTKN